MRGCQWRRFFFRLGLWGHDAMFTKGPLNTSGSSGTVVNVNLKRRKDFKLSKITTSTTSSGIPVLKLAQQHWRRALCQGEKRAAFALTPAVPVPVGSAPMTLARRTSDVPVLAPPKTEGTPGPPPNADAPASFVPTGTRVVESLALALTSVLVPRDIDAAAISLSLSTAIGRRQYETSAQPQGGGVCGHLPKHLPVQHLPP